MEKFFEEIEKTEKQIKNILEAQTELDTLEQLQTKLNQAKNNLNNYHAEPEKPKKEVFKKYAELETAFEFLREKTFEKTFEQVKQKTQKALEQLAEADEQINFILNNNFYYFIHENQKHTQRISNKIFDIILKLKEIEQEV